MFPGILVAVHGVLPANTLMLVSKKKRLDRRQKWNMFFMANCSIFSSGGTRTY